MDDDVEILILKNVPWAKVPHNVKQFLGHSQKEYERLIVDVSVRHQLRYRGGLVQRVCRNEQSYYEQLVEYSRHHLMLYPYHLSALVVKGLRLTPFEYYSSIVRDILLAERSYDSLPNFTAADCLRLLGIGRNQYIDLMNTCRRGIRASTSSTTISASAVGGGGGVFRRSRSQLPQLPQLPTQPTSSLNIQPGWRVDVGHVMEHDVKFLSSAEQEVIDRLIDEKSQLAGSLDRHVVHSLYSKGLVYVDVPVCDDECFSVPPLEGFVMNRVLGDFFEKLLYKIFVSIDETISVAELAEVLQIELPLVKMAVSVFCRLGFAFKKSPDVSEIQLHPSWQQCRVATPVMPHRVDCPTTCPSTGQSDSYSDLDDDLWIKQLQQALSSQHDSVDVSSTCSKDGDSAALSSCDIATGIIGARTSQQQQQQRVAFLFDSTLTAYLMMGNLSSCLKQHAVTMFEVGKLADESLGSLLAELARVDPRDQCEGEAERYFVHARALYRVICHIRNNCDLLNVPVDLLHWQSLKGLDAHTCSRLLHRNYRILVSMSPLVVDSGCLSYRLLPPHFGAPSLAAISVWFKLFTYHMCASGPPSFFLSKGTRLTHLPETLTHYDRLMVTSWDHTPVVIATSVALLTVNDALAHAAVLLQAFGWSNEGNTYTCVFPCDDSSDYEGNHLSDVCLVAPQMPQRVLFASIVRSMPQLRHCCGYMKFVNLSPSLAPVQETRSSDSVKCSDHSESDIEEYGSPLVVPLIMRPSRTLSRDLSLTQADTMGEYGRSTLERTLPSNIGRDPDNVSVSAGEASKGGTSAADCDGLDAGLSVAIAAGQNMVCGPKNGVCSREAERILQREVDRVAEDVEREASSFSSLSPSPPLAALDFPSREGASGSNQGWTLLELNLGIPLFDVELCDELLKGLSRRQAFSDNSLDQLNVANQQLANLLDEFIDKFKFVGGRDVCDEKTDGQVPPPGSSLCFLDGKLTHFVDT